jgi:glycosyltransferase involved in cell wall biosynthesis
MFNKLYAELYKQCFGKHIEVIYDDMGGTIGEKRNRLLSDANGEYVAFIDDDDTVASDYVDTLLMALSTSPDCVSLRGVITWDGANPELFEHSIKYSAYATTTNPIKYERYPNHLNCIKASIAKQFKFPEINHGEDTDWATQIKESGLLKKEVYIDKILYHYQYVTKKSY